jgi:hypothetical protein
MSYRPLATGLIAVALLAAGSAAAVETLPLRSDVTRCLTPPADRPLPFIYPTGSLQRMAGGTVSVELTFTGPDTPPRVTLLSGTELDAELVAAVRSHVAQYRLPCLAGADEARFRQDFAFVPNEGKKVTWTTPQEGGRALDVLLSCGTHVRPGSKADWPMRAKAPYGNVLLEMRFVAPDQPPKIEVRGMEPENPFAREAIDWAKGLRFPCMAKPFVAKQLYSFRMEGTPKTVLTDMPLTTFLRSVRDVAGLPVYFDFRTMGCPFEVRVKYWQPHERNAVGEVGNSLPVRRPFLDWLSGLVLDLKPAQQHLVLGDPFTLTVPCGTLDL